MFIGKTILDSIIGCIKKNNHDPLGNLVVAFSAGVDSSVLLHALATEISSLESCSFRKVIAIHVHHGLSDHADEWADQAQKFCKQLSHTTCLDIDCIIEKVNLNNRTNGFTDGLEQAAREARYQVFEEYCQAGDILLQGHHLDDQIETFFMRSIRGSGLIGLSGIPSERNLSRKNTCQILRPLLGIEKKLLVEYAKEFGLDWVEDESNQDNTITRNWWRNDLLPQIWRRFPDQKSAFRQTMRNIRHEQNLLQQLLLSDLDRMQVDQSSHAKIHPVLRDVPCFDLTLIENFEKDVAVSYLRSWLAQSVDILPSAIQMQTVYVDMVLSKQDSEPSFVWSQAGLYRYNSRLYLIDRQMINKLNDQSRLNEVHDWQGNELHCFAGTLSQLASKEEFSLKPDLYRVRNWQPGDVAKPEGRTTRKLKKWWQDYGIPSWLRSSWPIIVDRTTGEIACIPGLFVCQGYCVTPDDTGWLCEFKVWVK